MEPSDRDVARRSIAQTAVTRAYEQGHALAGLRGLALAGAIIVLAIAVHSTTKAMWLAAGALAATLGVLAWRGGAWRRGAFAGVLAGLPPLIVPSIVLALQSEHCGHCGARAMWPCLLACFGTSSLVGILVGYSAFGDHAPRKFALGAFATAALTGMLGCGTTGLGGALGVIVGMVAGGVTGWLVAPRTRSADV